MHFFYCKRELIPNSQNKPSPTRKSNSLGGRFHIRWNIKQNSCMHTFILRISGNFGLCFGAYLMQLKAIVTSGLARWSINAVSCSLHNEPLIMVALKLMGSTWLIWVIYFTMTHHDSCESFDSSWLIMTYMTDYDSYNSGNNHDIQISIKYIGKLDILQLITEAYKVQDNRTQWGLWVG